MAQPWVNAHKPKEDFRFATEEDRKLHEQVNDHVADMEDYAQPARQAAKDAIQGYMALTRATYQNRSKVFPPTIHAVTYARIALEAANTPKVEVKARKISSEPKMKTLNAAIRNAENGDGNLRPDSQNLWFQQNFDKIMFGTGFRYLGYLTQKRVVRVKDEEGNWEEKTMVVYDDVYDCVPDFFHVGVSRDMQPGMFGGSACYWDRWFTRDAFMEAFNDGLHMNLDKIPEGDWMQDETGHYWDVPEGWVRVRYYWNIYKDLMYVQANGVPIRKDFILDYGDPDRPQKFLPITSVHNDVNFDMQHHMLDGFPIFQDGRIHTDTGKSSSNKSFWSKSDPTLIKAMVGFKNALWRSATDHVKASSVHFLMTNNAGVYDQITTADLYGTVPLRAAEGTFDVKSMTENSAFFNQFVGMDEAVDNAMTYALGNDWRRAAAELTNEKATVAAIRQQVMRIRMNQNMKMNETGGIKRHYRILVNLIQQYYPEPVLLDLTDGEVPEGTEEEDIIRDADGVPVKIKRFKEVPTDDVVVEVKRRGKTILTGKDDPYLDDDQIGRAERMFKARPDYIRTEEEPEIYIEPGSTFAELKALERSLNLEEMQSLQFFMGLSYPTGEVSPEGVPDVQPLIPKEGAEYLLERHAETWEMDKDKLLGRDDVDEDSQLDEALQEPFGQAIVGAQQDIPVQTLPTQGARPQGLGNPVADSLAQV